ncbi:hypothetical protein EAH74_12010 [Pseudomonas mandelii]|uniref:Uncharacterized protein n=1 Tax=Pseudomonas mandelii TaxID=75612 RepID=A0A502IF24_9PSED|nr:hypothetical protein EAH74_12010 [Pseudomonas mandelii]
MQAISVFVKCGEATLRLLRNARSWINGVLTELLRDKDMAPNAGKGIHVSKEGALSVDFEDIQKSAGYQEALRRGDQVLSAEYRPLHLRNQRSTEAPKWIIQCAKATSDCDSLSISLPSSLADSLDVSEGDALVVTALKSGVVEMRKSRP